VHQQKGCEVIASTSIILIGQARFILATLESYRLHRFWLSQKECIRWLMDSFLELSNYRNPFYTLADQPVQSKSHLQISRHRI
jgi:hypothetical protein